jgi:autotransporter-associated beta strand protein
LLKTGAGAWVQQAQVCYDSSSRPLQSIAVDEGSFELSGSAGYLWVDSISVKNGAMFKVAGYNRMANTEMKLHTDGTAVFNTYGGTNEKFVSLTGKGMIMTDANASETTIDVTPAQDCRFDGKVGGKVSVNVFTGTGRLIVGDADSFMPTTGTISAGASLAFAPGTGFFRINMLNVLAGETVLLEDTAGKAITLETNLSAGKGGSVSGCGNLKVRMNTLSGSIVRSTGSLYVESSESSAYLKLGDGTDDFDFSTVSQVGSYDNASVKFCPVAALDLAVPLAGNGVVDAGCDGWASPSVTLRDVRKTGGTINVYSPLVLKGGDSILGFTGFAFKKAGASLTIDGGRYSFTRSAPPKLTYGRSDELPLGMCFSTAATAKDSQVLQRGGVFYHAGTYNAAAMRYDLEGGVLALTTPLQPSEQATLQNPSVYCFNGGTFACANDITSGNFNDGLFKRGLDQKQVACEGRLRLLLGPNGMRLSSIHTESQTGPQVAFNLPLESAQNSRDGGVVIDGNVAYAFEYPLSISGDVAVRDGGVVLPDIAATANAQRFFGDGSFSLRNASLVFQSCSSDKKLHLATAEGKGVAYEGASMISLRRGTAAAQADIDNYSAQTLVTGPLTRKGKGSVLFVCDGESGIVGESGRSSFVVSGGVGLQSCGLVKMPVVGMKNMSQAFLSYDKDAGFVPFAGAVDMANANPDSVVHIDVVAGNGVKVSGGKAIAALRIVSGYLTLNANSRLTVGNGVDPALFLLNSGASVYGPGTLDFGSSEGVFVVSPNSTDAYQAKIKAPIAGSGGVSFVSAPDHDFSWRRIVLEAANTYSGGTCVNSVRLDVNNAQALGSGPVRIGGGTRYGGRLAFSVDAEISNNFEIGGRGIRDTRWNGFQNRAAIECHADVKLTGDVELTELARLTVPVDGKRLTLSGTVSGDALEILHDAAAQAGTVALEGHNTYTGGTDVARGTLALVHGDGAGTGRVRLDGGELRFENASGISFGNDISGAGTVALAGGGEVLFKGDVSGLDATLDICASVTLSGLPPFKTIRNSSGGTVTVSLASGLGTVMWDGRTLEDGATKFRIAVGEGTLLDLGGATLAVDRAVRDSARRIVNGTLIETDPESSLVIFIR